MSVPHCLKNAQVSVVDLAINLLSLEEFELQFLKANHPVLIKNYLHKLPCSKWTIDYLLKSVGNNEVTVRGKTHLQHYKVRGRFKYLIIPVLVFLDLLTCNLDILNL